MNILTVCSGGNCRSVALAMLLKLFHKQKDVLAMGIDYTSDKTRNMLFKWADQIIVVGEVELKDKVKKKTNKPVAHFDVGPDIWNNPFDRNLLFKLNAMLIEAWGQKK